jgi:asparagine synthetase B (glutamine-hydrolysing)
MENEMSLDLDRIWHRNMGRDDRAISDNGKEARFPYLDSNLIQYLG